MSENASDRNVLFGILAVQLGFVRQQDLRAAMQESVRDKSRSADEILVQQGWLSNQQRRLLSDLLDEHLKRQGNDPAQSLAALISVETVRSELTVITDADFQDSLERVVPASPDAADLFATLVDSSATLVETPTRAGGETSVAELRNQAVGEVTVADRPIQAVGEQTVAEFPRQAVGEATVADRPIQAGGEQTVAGPLRQAGGETVGENTPRPAGAAKDDATMVAGGADQTTLPNRLAADATMRSDATIVNRPASSSSSLGALTSEGRRFSILRPHARGGLGQVSLAKDLELNRDVALKELLAHCADHEESRFRFLLEAEITGALEHPGIVPVYGLGQYADGRPYYAMRFVRGDSLAEAIVRFHDPATAPSDPGQRTVELRRLLGRFIDVCEAIQYAHTRGVLHRDLKPGNIMLGKYGETLVVDWGLATTAHSPASSVDYGEQPVHPVLSRSLSGSATATQAGAVVGTPAYMSPEQAAGQIDKLGPASDIYSLGATLYHLLTGKAPFAAQSLSELLKRVRHGQFAPPRTVDARVPPPLNAICLKAMALQPAERYESAAALAEDVEQWLADEPVSVWREPFSVRAARWVRRHRTLVSSLGATIGASLILLSIGIVLLAAANEREREARAEAERAFQTARQAVDKYYTYVSENVLLDQPGMQTLRRELLQEALAYYQQFVQEHAGDPKLQDELAVTHFYVGNILEVVETPQQALPSYEAALRIQKELLGQQPQNRARIAALGDTWNALGRALDRMRKHDEAIGAFDEAVRLREQLVHADADNHEYQRKLANTDMNLGLAAKGKGDLAEALRQYEQGQTVRQQILRRKPDLHRVRRDLGQGEYNTAVVQLMLGDMEAAGRHLVNAAEAFERVLQSDPRDLNTQYQLAVCLRLLGDLKAAGGDLAAAQSRYDQAESHFELLAYHNPDVPEYQAGLAGVAMNRGNFQFKLGGPEMAEAARQSLRQAIGILEKLVEQYPEAASYPADLQAARGALEQFSQ